MLVNVFFGATIAVVLSSSVSGRIGSEGRRGEVNPLPVWDKSPPSPITHLNKGDIGEIDPRGAVRYNLAPNGRVMKGIITRHREVPVDDNGTGLEQATEDCCFADSYE